MENKTELGIGNARERRGEQPDVAGNEWEDFVRADDG